jgi:hypothetical protein
LGLTDSEAVLGCRSPAASTLSHNCDLATMKLKALDKEDQAKWDAFVRIGVRLVTKNQWKRYRLHQRRFVRFVDRLLDEYGQAPRLLATRADMMHRDSAKLPYLTRAYRGAVARHDRQEMVFSAHSIAGIHLSQGRAKLAALWVKRLRQNLTKHRDRLWARDCTEMEREIKRMRTWRPTVRRVARERPRSAPGGRTARKGSHT